MSCELFESAEVTWRDGRYPFVNLRMKNGMVVRGLVVPEHLEDKLPHVVDGMKVWSNPLFLRAEERLGNGGNGASSIIPPIDPREGR